MILVPALVMGTLLVGALFYVAAVGDAILFRTELQNAADVTAFKSAVWHARGMNVIAVLNILMSLALAVFAAIRIAEIVLFVLGLIPLIGAPFMTAANSLVRSEGAIHRIIDAALKVVGGAEDAVSAAVPYVALADAKRTPTAAHTVWPLSLALVPPQADRILRQDPARRPGYLPAALPIEEGTFGKLCGKAATFIPKQIASLIERTNIPFSDKFKDLADVVLDDIGGHVFGAGDGLFCQPINGMISSLVSYAAGAACEQAQEIDQQAEDERAQQEEAERAANADPNQPEDPEEAEERRRRRGRRRSDGSRREPIDCEEGLAAQADQAADRLTFDARPSLVWKPAGNGNVFTHSWSWVQGEPRLFANQQRIARANRGSMPQITPATGATAMAEYYFDCEDGWDSEHCEWDAPWEPNWTARMRRFRSPGEELVRIGLDFGFEILETLQQSVGDHAAEIIGGAMRRAIGVHEENPLAQWLGQQIDNIPVVRELSEKIDSVVGGLREASGVDDLLSPRRYTDANRVH